MSGGVDSSVSAYLLKKKGYDVQGVSIQTCGNSHSDAKNIAKFLNIPFHIVNIENDFKNYVIQYYIDTYKEGRTPNPCVICNRYVKFQALLKKAKELDIPYIATGHYANVKYDWFRKRYTLKKGKDKSKDQSYVLYNLTQEQLSKCIFPLGNCKKSKVRKIAKKIDMEVAEKDDSQDICFNVDINDMGGNIVDTEGNILGRHNGISKYTIGQRKGIKISSKYPLYVVDIDMENNQIIVGKENDILKDELLASNINWVSIEKPKKEIIANVKIRYSTKDAKACIKPKKENTVLVKFNKKQRAITPGQAVVFYKGDTVLGGGIIV